MNTLTYRVEHNKNHVIIFQKNIEKTFVLFLQHIITCYFCYY